jgi:hypothetical protein
MHKASSNVAALVAVESKSRVDVIATIAILPDEAFDFCVAQLTMIGASVGGFRPDSREGLLTLQRAASEYFTAKEGKPPAA